MSDAVNKPAHYNQGPIECIDAMQQILTPEEFRGFLKGNVFKYLWREKGKNGIEDLRKGKDYYDRLIQSFDESEDQPVIKQSSTTEPPDGWRWLEVGEVIRKGDRYFKDHEWRGHDLWVGGKIRETDRPSVRRNRFGVGEKVVRDFSECVYEITAILDRGCYEMQTPSGYKIRLYAKDLAPYIEETT